MVACVLDSSAILRFLDGETGFEIVLDVSAERALASAAIAADHGISHADPSAVQLTVESIDRVLVTAAYGLIAEALISVNFLPFKPPA